MHMTLESVWDPLSNKKNVKIGRAAIRRSTQESGDGKETFRAEIRAAKQPKWNVLREIQSNMGEGYQNATHCYVTHLAILISYFLFAAFFWNFLGANRLELQVASLSLRSG